MDPYLLTLKYIDNYNEAYLNKEINFKQFARYHLIDEIRLNKELYENITQLSYQEDDPENIIRLVNAGEYLFQNNKFSVARMDQMLKIKPFFKDASDRYDLLLKLDGEKLNIVPPSLAELPDYSDSLANLYLFGILNSLEIKIFDKTITKEECIDFYKLEFMTRPTFLDFEKEENSAEILYMSDNEIKSFGYKSWLFSDLIKLAFLKRLPIFNDVKTIRNKDLLIKIAKNPPNFEAEYFEQIKDILTSKSPVIETFYLFHPEFHAYDSLFFE